jgi:hypothetical protein
MAKVDVEQQANIHSYRLDVVWDRNPPGWFAVLTWYADDTAIASCTAKASSITEVNRIVWDGLFRAQGDFDGGKLVLPHQGDYEITYYTREE